MNEKWSANIFSMDLRALAAFRIVFGCVVSIVLLQSLSNATAFYTDLGFLPKDLNLARPMGWYWSLNYLSDSVWFPHVLISMGLVACAAFVLGWKTRWAGGLLWLIICSLHARNPQILNSGDSILRLQLFWSLFLPLDSRYALRPRIKNRTSVFSAATVAFILQIYMMYWFTGLMKWHPVWYSEGSAIYFVLHMKQYAKNWAEILLSIPLLCQFATYATLGLELMGPTLLLVPSHRQILRVVIPLCFIFFHLALSATMILETFPFVCIAIWIAILPATFWDCLEKVPMATAVATAEKKSSLKSLRAALITAALTLIVMWNLCNLNGFPYRLSKNLSSVLRVFLLDQHWGMFSPVPGRYTYWPIVKGQLKSGQSLDIYQHQPYTQSMPQDFSSWQKNMRYEKFFSRATVEGNEVFAHSFANFLCADWNRSNSDQALNIELAYMKLLTPLPSEPVTPAEKVVVLQEDCKM